MTRNQRAACVFAGIICFSSPAHSSTTVIGDSMAACCVGSGYADDRWPDQLGFTNDAVNGTRVGWWLEPGRLAGISGGSVWVELGTNTAIGSSFDAAAWGDDMRELVERLYFDRGVNAVRLVHSSIAQRGIWAEWQRRVVALRFAELRTERQAICDALAYVSCPVDLEDMGNEWKKLDDLHWTQAGHDEVARRVPEPGGLALGVAACAAVGLVRWGRAKR